MLTFCARHPFLTGFGILFGLAAIVAYWPLFLILALCAGLAAALWAATRAYDQHALERARTRHTLAADADYEHHMLMAGDPRGIYGRYPPAR